MEGKKLYALYIQNWNMWMSDAHSSSFFHHVLYGLKLICEILHPFDRKNISIYLVNV